MHSGNLTVLTGIDIAGDQLSRFIAAMV